MRFALLGALAAVLLWLLPAARGLACDPHVAPWAPQSTSQLTSGARSPQAQPAPTKPAPGPQQGPQPGAQQAKARPGPGSGRGAAKATAPWKSVEIGYYYWRRKNYRAALSRFEEAVTTDPEYAEGYLGLGRVYERTGDRRKALAAYQKYLDLLPSDRDAENAKQVHRAMARLEKGSDE